MCGHRPPIIHVHGEYAYMTRGNLGTIPNDDTQSKQAMTQVVNPRINIHERRQEGEDDKQRTSYYQKLPQ